jgi:ribosomal-protein-alanine N-acetyltransferase
VKGNLREISEADLGMVFDWRNKQEVREASFHNNLITLEEHSKWWDSVSTNPLVEILIYEWRGNPVGVVTFKYDGPKMISAQWSFYIGNAVEPGIGTRMCQAAIEYLFYYRNVHELTGQVISLNERSSNLHLKLGFTETERLNQAYKRAGEKYDVIYLSLQNVLFSDDLLKEMESYDLKLRPLKASDIDSEYISWYSNRDGHLNHFTGSRRTFNQQSILDDYYEGSKTGRWFYYLIETGSGDKVGNVKVGLIDSINMTSDLVCLVGNRKFIGKGLASKAIKVANEVAFSNHYIRRLQGGMYEDHIASFKAYTRAGWQEEARLKGYYWVDGKAVDRICVSCLNPRYFEVIEND